MTTKRRNLAQQTLQTVIRQLRMEAGLNQAKLAAKLGRPQSYVSKYESGERYLSFIEVEEICDAVEVPLATFIRRYQEGK